MLQHTDHREPVEQSALSVDTSLGKGCAGAKQRQLGSEASPRQDRLTPLSQLTASLALTTEQIHLTRDGMQAILR